MEVEKERRYSWFAATQTKIWYRRSWLEETQLTQVTIERALPSRASLMTYWAARGALLPLDRAAGTKSSD